MYYKSLKKQSTKWKLNLTLSWAYTNKIKIKRHLTNLKMKTFSKMAYNEIYKRALVINKTYNAV